MTSAQTSPQQWARGMLVPGRAAVLDVESTNLDGSIIEICVLDAATGDPLLDTLVDPGEVAIHPDAYAVHGIAPADLIGAPGWSTVHQALISVTAGRVTLSYHSEFDKGRVLHDCARHGLDPAHLADPEMWGCIMRMRSQAEGTEKSIRLDGGHRARSDAAAARTVLLGIAEGTSAPSTTVDPATTSHRPA
ncbi:3'-5' exonuclease [Rhodococcus sp. NPDC019627]|uniref:3'-5' exonuclease n=1 Tax=unclassified Rhodococcus (in: high G+C Gram-positive bacteria) TaxID=192944 RepID=UPI0033FC27E0